MEKKKNIKVTAVAAEIDDNVKVVDKGELMVNKEPKTKGKEQQDDLIV